jgi:hypothetical protein
MENEILTNPLIGHNIEFIGSPNAIRAALVNTQTGVVENIIMVNSFEDAIDENYKLVEIYEIEVLNSLTEDEIQLYSILKEIDPDFKMPMMVYPVNINETKWSEEKGFYEE